jgi:hypothetical protein
MSVATFFAEYEAATKPNPFNEKERVWLESLFPWRARACFTLQKGQHEECVTLWLIRSLERGKGDGSAALAWLCDLADRHGVMLTGTIQPNGMMRPRLTVKQLKAWYRRNGFVVTANNCICRIGIAATGGRKDTPNEAD